MLVLSRQRNESIIIGDDVEVTIVDVRGDKVRLGITAPRNIPVHRREVYEAIQREKREKLEKSQKDEKEAEKQLIEKVLREANNNKVKAAKILGIHRSLLYKKMESYNIPNKLS